MAFAIGEFIGGFIAAIFIPLFLFYLADRKGCSIRAAIISRSVAVLLAVLAVVAEAVGGGGNFPAGAVLAVIVCFVWAVRSSLRDRQRRLNGWQRLAVIGSVLWLPIGFVGAVALFVHTQTAGWESVYNLCETVAEQQQENRGQERAFAQQKIERTQEALGRAYAAGDVQAVTVLQTSLAQQQLQQRSALPSAGSLRASDDAKCLDEYTKNYSAAIVGRGWAGLTGALFPLAVLWGLAWVCLILYRWVHAGFVRQDA